MVDVNDTKRFLWCYEGAGAAGTAVLTTAALDSYYFGIYNKNVNEWNFPSIANKITNYHTYDSRNPTLADGGALMPDWRHTYIPTSGTHLVWQMGKVANGASPATFTAADYDTEQFAIEIRAEEGDGSGTSNYRIMQLNGAYSTKLYGYIQAGDPYIVEQTFNYMNYNDSQDYALLTNTPTYPDGETAPYVGLPKVTYDPDGTPYIIPNVIKFDYTSESVFSQAYTNSTETDQVIYKERFLPTRFTLTCISEVNTIWDDFIDRVDTKNLEVIIYKADTSEYIILDLTGIEIIGWDSQGEGYSGYYVSTLVGEAASLSGSFTYQGTFATHYQGEDT